MECVFYYRLGAAEYYLHGDHRRETGGTSSKRKQQPTTAVWFNDVEVSVKNSLIVQETHYDPWGLELAGIEKIGMPEHRWKYNGKERISDLDLNWNDHGARYYHPQLGN